MSIEKRQIGPCTLYLADCLDVLPTLEGVDACITDPPYGIKRDCGMGGDGYDGFGNGIKRQPKTYAGGWDDSRPSVEMFRNLAAYPLSIIWGGNYFADCLPVNGKWLVWDKQNTMPSYSDCELAWTNLKGTSVKMFRYNGSGLMAKEKGRVHPTQKPIALMQWCLSFVPDAKTILDPYAGSGTTALACIRMGRSFIGIEKDPQYFQVACERIERELAQLTLALK